MALRKYFEIEKKPHQGLLTVEWVILGYWLLTLLFVLFTSTKMQDSEALIWGRVKVLAVMVAMWAVYRMIPCRFTLLCRVTVQLALLSWWYPDTYELNRILPNLDHLFAGYEQQLFGCQPALLFSETVTNPVFSELMYLGYVSYFPLIAVITAFFFFWRYAEFNRAVFVILASFFLYYVIFIFLPVTGPQYYYEAVGLDQIAQGIFPNVQDYFATHNALPSMPGYSDGFFYDCVANAHATGERPTAAFPSSHVGITTILVFLAWRAKSRLLFYGLLPFYILMCLATVYIRAHYLIDVIGGWVSAVIFYILLQSFWTLAKRRY
ncbi:MAG: phosphatase PAP2 family protein [Prevotella sp.]|nr:phosphatase PAP2 family protein [Prevotella sp.]